MAHDPLKGVDSRTTGDSQGASSRAAILAEVGTPSSPFPVFAASAWFRRRYSHWSDWPEERVLEARQRSNESVCVVVPTLNEAANIGQTVDVILEARARGLVDHLLVIDSGSADGTPDIARAHGARVAIHQEVFPEVGSRSGKGEALWKGLRESSGDIVVYIDADISNIAMHFITGLLGPILSDDRLALVKGCFDRPYLSSGASEGGRTTELMARPLLAAYFPELSHVVQPMGGEYAARRSVLSNISYAPDYAVDIGILIDVYLAYGLDSIAQVDLGSRVHKHQDIRALGRMSASVLHAVLHRVTVGCEPEAAVVQFSRDAHGSLQPSIIGVETRSRPPVEASSTNPRRAS